MSAPAQISSTVEALDSHLATGRFGDADYLQANVAILYDGLADIVAGKLGCSRAAIALSPGLSPTAHVLRRRSLDEAFASLAASDAPCAIGRVKLVQETLARPAAATHDKVGPLTFLRHGSGDSAADEIAETYCRVMAKDGFLLKPEGMAPEQIPAAHSAIAVLNRLMPQSGVTTFQLAPTVVLFSGEIESAYINDNPTAFQVNVDRFCDTLILAEALLHESLHQKMVDIRLTSNLLIPEYDDIGSEEAGDILVPWPDVDHPRYWSFARSLAAQHVYVHLTVLYAAAYGEAEQSGSCEGVSKQEVAKRLRTSFERARYLGAAHRHPAASRNGGADASLVLDWLEDVTDVASGLLVDGERISTLVQEWDPTDVRMNVPSTELAA